MMKKKICFKKCGAILLNVFIWTLIIINLFYSFIPTSINNLLGLVITGELLWGSYSKWKKEQKNIFLYITVIAILILILDIVDIIVFAFIKA